MFARKVIGLLGLTLFVLPFFSVASARAISHRTGDSTAVSNLLLQARKECNCEMMPKTCSLLIGRR